MAKVSDVYDVAEERVYLIVKNLTPVFLSLVRIERPLDGPTSIDEGLDHDGQDKTGVLTVNVL